ncbi:MAG: response regulator [Gammaproteobacteria bacterium]
MNSASPRILVVDDDLKLAHLLQEFLSQHHFDVTVVHDGEMMFAQLAQQTFSLILLDIMLPGDDGITLCRKLRQQNSNIPIIMLTAVDEDIDKVAALEVGTDYYITKPVNLRVLLACIKSVLRRFEILSNPTNQGQDVAAVATHDKVVIFKFADWLLNASNRQLTSPDGIDVEISTGEFHVLKAFLTHSKRVLTRDQLLDYAFHRGLEPFDRSIDVFVSRLRRKLEINRQNPQLIKTVHGLGYRFDVDVQYK